MRLILQAAGCVLSLAIAVGVANPAATAAAGQNALDESQSKAKQLVQQTITALGGDAYLSARDVDCSGRLAQFARNGAVAGYVELRDLWLLPDKNRKEFTSKGSMLIAGYVLGQGVAKGGAIIQVFNGDQGWLRDKGGVSDQPEDAIRNFAEQSKSSMDHFLRARLNEPGLTMRYTGQDVLDLKPAEWIEFTDRDHRVFRLAVEQSSHLPLRWVVVTRDPKTRERDEAVTGYTQFITADGIRTPLKISRSQNDRELYQIFWTGCRYNSDVSPEMFTKAGLERH